jgi:hypothetical protein
VAQVLANKGFKLPGIDDVFKAEISCFICDAPARAYVKNIKSHSGYHSCERCEQRGEYIDGKVTFLETQSSKITDELFHACNGVTLMFGRKPHFVCCCAAVLYAALACMQRRR